MFSLLCRQQELIIKKLRFVQKIFKIYFWTRYDRRESLAYETWKDKYFMMLLGND